MGLPTMCMILLLLFDVLKPQNQHPIFWTFRAFPAANLIFPSLLVANGDNIYLSPFGAPRSLSDSDPNAVWENIRVYDAGDFGLMLAKVTNPLSSRKCQE